MKQTNRLKSAAVIAFGLLIHLASAVQAEGADATPMEQLNAMQNDYANRQHAAADGYQHSDKGPDAIKAFHAAQPSPARYVERAIALAKAHPEDPACYASLAFAVRLFDTSWDWKTESITPDETLRMLDAKFADNPHIDELFDYLKDLSSQPAFDLLRDIGTRNPRREIRAEAKLAYARNLANQINLLDIFRDVPAFKTMLETSMGKDWVSAYTIRNEDALRREAIASLRQLLRDYPDVKGPAEPLADTAEHLLFQLEKLAVGQPAPDIVGKDQNGVEMKLSDYRGKVVALVFWGGWCGVCMQQARHERELVEQMHGKPFVLLGVDSDPIEKLPAIISKNQINWRSWADGDLDGPRPISRTWNVGPWPQVYVIDANGVIRYTELAHEVKGDELERAVASLLAK